MNAKTRLFVALLGLGIVAIVSVLAVTFSGSGSPSATAMAAAAPADATATIANCRYGVTPLDGDSVQIVSEVGAGWYLSFRPSPGPNPPANNAEFAHMISIRQKKNGDQFLPGYNVNPPLDSSFAAYIKQNPGEIYIAGNEVDRIGQGETFPDVYARAYHDVYKFIKRIDPTAQVAISGLVQVTPNRLQYLDLVWKNYLQTYGHTMPVDIWTMHLYVLPELLPDGKTPNDIASIALGTDPALGKRESGGNASLCSQGDVYCYAEHDDITIFAEQVTAMRQWMKAHGQQNKPLLLTEFSILYPYEIDAEGCFLSDEFGNCFTPARISTFMSKAFNYMNNARDAAIGYPLDGNRLLQRSMWFSVYYNLEGASSNLVKADRTTLTQVGQNFKNSVLAEGRYRNLLVEPLRPVSAALEGNSVTTAVLSATFRNNGNEAVQLPFKVSFYRDAALTQLIGSVDVDPGVSGCATRPYTISVPWTNLGRGTHNYWVFVDSGNVVPELPANNADNVGQGVVRIYESQVRLPFVRG